MGMYANVVYVVYVGVTRVLEEHTGNPQPEEL